MAKIRTAEFELTTRKVNRQGDQEAAGVDEDQIQKKKKKNKPAERSVSGGTAKSAKRKLKSVNKVGGKTKKNRTKES